MANNRKMQTHESDKWKMTGPRIWIPCKVLQGRAWANLSYSAKALLIDLAGQLRARKGEIYNNGDLTTALKILNEIGWTRRGTVQKAAKELEAVNLICMTRQGRLPNLATLYAVTWLPLNESNKIEISSRGFPFQAYILEDPSPVVKKKVEVEKRPSSSL